ncbi:MAG: hypothetical protein ACOX4F_09080 [Atopobiaceae bacterium]|jgi:hypothetical protein
MEVLIGILLIISFFGFAYYCIKGYNLMMGFLVMATLWLILSLVGTLVASPAFIEANTVLQFGPGTDTTLVKILNTVYQSGPEGWGTILINFLFGAWFGRVLMDTGIASTIIRKTVELGGDKPLITVILLDIVTAIIFTSMTGAGPVMAVGVIVLPILMSLGIPKAIALFTFIASVGAGSYLNPVFFQQYRAFVIDPSALPEFSFAWYAQNWGYYAMGIMVVITIIMTAVYLHATKKSHAWAAQAAPQAQKDAPGYTLILPLLPVILNIAFNFSVIGGFLLAGMLALWLCGKFDKGMRENIQYVSKLMYDGTVDTAPMVGFLLCLPMFNTVARYASPYFSAVLGPIIPQSEILICILFTVLLFFSLFRGPLTLVGCGAATLGVLSNVASFSVPFLYCVFAIPTITGNLGSCITQSWTAWGLSYTKVESKDFLRLSVPTLYVGGALLYILTYFLMGNLGQMWFA